MGTIDSMKSILTQYALDVLCEKFHIPDNVHPELPGPNNMIRNSPIDILEYFQINLSQLSVIVAAKNDHFFWVDASVFHLAVPWHNNKTLRKDPHPTPAEFNANVCNYLADNPAPFRKLPEPFLCFVGISRYYDLDENCYLTFWAGDDEEMDLFAFINHVDPNKVRRGMRGWRGRGSVASVNQGMKFQLLLLKILKFQRKRKTADGASGSSHPPKKLKEDHSTSGHVGDSTGGKSLAAIQELFEQSTLNMEVGVTVAAIVPFVTSSVTPTPERGDNAPTNFVFVANLRTQRPSERSSVPPPPLMTPAIATTVIAGAISAQIFGLGVEPVPRSIFRDSASPSTAKADVAGPSQPAGAETSTNTFLVSQDLDSETLQHVGPYQQDLNEP
ncbi:hypothetical protein Tco_0415539 [Tanacetum coccineum]